VTPLYPQKLALNSPTGGGRSVGIVRSRTKATEFYDNNSGYFTWRPMHAMVISRLIILRMGNVSDNICRESQNTHTMSNNFFENPAVCEIR